MTQPQPTPELNGMKNILYSVHLHGITQGSGKTNHDGYPCLSVDEAEAALNKLITSKLIEELQNCMASAYLEDIGNVGQVKGYCAERLAQLKSQLHQGRGSDDE